MRVIGIAGYSGSGKTTLILKLLKVFAAKGLKVSTLKHAHHNFDVDVEGKDSHNHRLSGAHEVLVASRNRYALMHELRGEAEPPLAELLTKLSPVDLVLIEGYKKESHPKLWLHRQDNGGELPEPHTYKAMISDDKTLSSVHLDGLEAIIALIFQHAESLDIVLRQLKKGQK